MHQESRAAQAAGRPALLSYWPEVDGLRAIAVLTVLVFHFDRRLLGGGFIGVDVFYVISGFLIGAILLQDREDRDFSLARFYQRRIARIAPAFFVVIAATLLGAWAIYSEQDFASAGAAASAAALLLANVKFMLQGDYFAVSPDAQPLLHYWSLAVEEQFYLIFPVYLYAVTRWTCHALKITLALAALSLLLCIAVTWRWPVHAFYLLPTRGWELLAGVAVTMLRWRGVALPAAAARWLPWAGIGLILASALLLRNGPAFPGALALLPVLGTMALLATVGQGHALHRALARPLPAHVGRRSYSLYLWHWPVFALTDYALHASDGWLRGGVKLGLALGLAWLCHALVERPARGWLNRRDRRWIAYAGFAAAAGATVAAGNAIRAGQYLDASPASVASGGIAAAAGDRGAVVLIGDSQAASYARRLALLARERGYALNVLGVPGGEQLPGLPGTQWAAVRAYLAARRPAVVVVAEAWTEKLSGPEPLRALLDALAPTGARVVLVQQIPAAAPGADRAGIRRGARAPFGEDPALAAQRLRARGWVTQAAAGRALVIDPAALFLRDGAIDLTAPSGRLNYHDSKHLSGDGAARAMPLFDEALKRAR